jgi:hypothetical protein
VATDLADYSQAVQVLGGTVSIAGPVTATISGTVTVSISGTPTVNIGTAPTITVTGSVSITGTATVSISGTPSVNIASGTVNIGGTPIVNVQQANGVTIFGPNLMPPALAGPITTQWSDFGNGNTTLSFLANGQLQIACNNAAGNPMGVHAFSGIGGSYGLRRVNPGETYHFAAQVIADTHNLQARVYANTYDAAGVGGVSLIGVFVSTPVSITSTY